MILSVFLVLVSFLLIVALKLASMLLAERMVVSREELSPYECGFEHHNISRVPISLRYFILTLLFLLFDLEVVFLLFLPALVVSSSLIPLLLAYGFIVFLFLSLIYEWNDGTLEWLV